MQRPKYSHDLGGNKILDDYPKYWTPIDRSQHQFQYWEKQVDTLPGLLETKGLFNVIALGAGLSL